MKKSFFLITLSVFVLASCHVGRFFIYNFSDIRDYKKFPSKPLTAAEKTFHFSSSVENKFRFPDKDKDGKPITIEKILENNATVAFMVIRNDTILYQWYRQHYDSSSIVPSFSMAKSFVSCLIGIAIGEGKIKSVDEPITNYLTFKNANELQKVTIQHLLDMRSGIKNIENYYNPFGDVAKHYYGRHLKHYVKNLQLRCEPGTEFEYLSVNTQLLGLILEKATGMSNTAYLQEKIWSPVGMEFDASWSIDSKAGNTEKAFCCINARARDFAKFGRLFLNKGNWNGTQLVPESWVNQSAYNFGPINNFLYTSQWWHNKKYWSLQDSVKLRNEAFNIVRNTKEPEKSYLVSSAKDFFADGHLGQFIYVQPENNIVVVRLGKRPGSINWPLFMRNVTIYNALQRP